MASSLSANVFLLILSFFLGICFSKLEINAPLIPSDEVNTLHTIFKNLEINSYWHNIGPTSCNHINETFLYYISDKIFSNVTCNCSYNKNTVCHVTQIFLKGLNLTGVLSEEFGNLTQLQEIDLSRNYINGTIPKRLSMIPLVKLSLLGNRISGSIPDEIGDIITLRELDLEDNRLEGSLPKSLGTLKNLGRLILAGNNFTGSIPETFAKLTKLYELRINGNSISGKIPGFIGSWKNLTTLDIQGTSMEGPIPANLSILTNMSTLRISDFNSTSRTFPNLSNLKKLKYLVLRNCLITGLIPHYIMNFTTLKLLDLSYNQLTGPIPDLQNIRNFSYLILTNNLLSGSLPSWILNSQKKFDVSYNNFSEPPTGWCQQQPTTVDIIASFSTQNSSARDWCMMKDLPCLDGEKYYSLFINCGGSKKINYLRHDYEIDDSKGGASSFFVEKPKWAYSSTGSFMYMDNASSLAEDLSYPNLPDLYQTARRSPLSLKYYGLCLRQGSYNVKLHFAEIMFPYLKTNDTVGRRFFDVSIQGNKVLQDFNIAEEAGGVGKNITKEFKKIYVNSTRNTLEIHLYWAGKGTTSTPNRYAYGPLISGITVTPNYRLGSRLSTGVIVGVVVASCIILAIFLVILRMKGYLAGRDHANEEFRGLNTGYFTLRQIKIATDDFSSRNKIGEGGFGPVYKGVLPDGKVIAVKQLSSKSKQGNREFVNEIGMISALQHPNLVKLYGCCIEGKELLLVYEYMDNNSLARALFGQEDQNLKLDWQTRKKICLGMARGLAYLHEESRLKIVHRDIKSTNVLLDKDLNAKISDFGLARLDEEENTHISTRIAGTIGYMAPEYAMRGYLTDKADIYSFGIVVLEIVSGKSNTSYRPKEEFVYLLDWACVLQEQGNILDIVDPNLGSNYSQEEALRLLNLALICANLSPTLRPKMSSVISMIDGHIPVQAPIVNQSVMNENLRFKAFEKRSLDSKNHVSTSSQSSLTQRSLSMNISLDNSSISTQSKINVGESSSASATLELM